MARAWPIIRGNNHEMPVFREQPTGASAVVNLAPAATNRTSATSAWMKPMPAHTPLTAAMMGLGISSGNVWGRRGRSDNGRPSATPASAPASRPAQNPFPAPVTTMARTSGLSEARTRRSKYRSSISSVHTFRRSGRLSVSNATPSPTSYATTPGSSGAARTAARLDGPGPVSVMGRYVNTIELNRAQDTNDDGASAVTGWNYARTWETLAAEVPDREAIVGGARRLTYGEFDARATRLAHVLAAHGVGRGDVVAISLPNRPEYLEAFFAALKVGAAPANLNYQYVASEIAYVVRDCDAAAIVFPAAATDTITAAVREVGGRAAAAARGRRERRRLRDRPRRRPLQPHARREREPDGDDLLFLYTGGTTGRPKGVVWRTEDYYLQAWEAARPGTTPPDPPPRCAPVKRAATLLPASPLVHADRARHGHRDAQRRGHGGPPRGTTPRRRRTLATRQREHVAVMSIVGETFARPLLDALDRDGDRLDLRALRAIVSSGMAFTATSKQRFLDRLPGLTIVDTLGTSEALITRSTVTGTRAEVPSTFAAAANVRVVADDGREVVPGSDVDGVLAVAGRLPVGYHNDPEATARMFRVLDGVRYATPGDRARVLADGSIVLLGRGSVCINTGGEKVYPEEVEAVLARIAAVTDAAVVGVPDDRWGEAVVALVELEAAGPDLTDVDDELFEHCRAHLAGYKRPKRILAVDAIDRTVAGKPDYRTLPRSRRSELPSRRLINLTRV